MLTPERAKQLAEAEGCKFFPTGLTGNRFVIERSADNWAYISAAQLAETSEHKFRYFYIPDRRD